MGEVYRGLVTGVSGSTGNGAQVTLYYTDQETVSWGSMGGTGVFTFSEAGTYLVSATVSSFTGSPNPDYLDLYIGAAGQTFRSRMSATPGGWGLGAFTSTIFTVAASDTLTVAAIILGFGSDGLSLGAPPVSKHLTITRLPSTAGPSTDLFIGHVQAASNVTGDSTQYQLLWNEASAHPDLTLNTGTGVLTCNTTGTYYVAFSSYFTGGNTSHGGITQRLKKNGADNFVNYQYSIQQIVSGSHFSTGIDLTAGDTMAITNAVDSSTKILDLGIDANYTQWRVCRLF